MEKGKGFANSFRYPQIHKLADENVKNKINKQITMIANSDLNLEDASDITYFVLENANNRLVIEKGATLTAYETGDSKRQYYRVTFNLTTGEFTEESW